MPLNIGRVLVTCGRHLLLGTPCQEGPSLPTHGLRIMIIPLNPKHTGLSSRHHPYKQGGETALPVDVPSSRVAPSSLSLLTAPVLSSSPPLTLDDSLDPAARGM